jgi:hypothetical protein
MKFSPLAELRHGYSCRMKGISVDVKSAVSALNPLGGAEKI